VCKGTIAGFGLDSYILALDSFLNWEIANQVTALSDQGQTK
jgi:3-dehydroquinate dehydratase